MHKVDETHDPEMTSWVDSANDPLADFPIQNLPYGRFLSKGSNNPAIGIAIGNQVLDLTALGLTGTDMTAVLAWDSRRRGDLRRELSAGLRKGSAKENAWRKALHPLADIVQLLPCDIGDYTDFYAGIHHARAVGKLFRPDNPLMQNYKWVPVGYHGRSSSIRVSGYAFPRPLGQTKSPDADKPSFGPCRRLDYELELGYVIGRGNEQGQPIAIADAEEHLFGITLLNDWSARDIQLWEYQPLGPFLSKSFATTLSPWIVTTEALAPYRSPLVRPETDPAPLPYLDDERNRRQGGFDINLEVLIQTSKMREENQAPQRLTVGNISSAAYWTAAQLVSHHTVNGCNLRPGDLFGSGTLSGPRREESGSLLELTEGGKQALALTNGETRTFLEDGDTLILKAWCEGVGKRRIGFGVASGTVLPALP